MKRRHVFEFNEAAWLPAAGRALVTDYLRTLSNLIEPFSPQLPLIVRALRYANGEAGVIDLGAGALGPWRHLSGQLNRLAGRRVPVWLTDKHPGPDPAASCRDLPDVAYYPESVDATAVPAEWPGLRVLFNGLHQFEPEAATGILSDVVASGQPVAVMEMLNRHPRDFAALLLSPLLVWWLTPWVRPFSLRRLLLTYVLPLAPALVLWDSLASTLRCYTPDELKAMAQDAGGEHYVWHAGSYRHRGAPVTYLIGYPREPA